MDNDPLGHELFEARIGEALLSLEKMLNTQQLPSTAALSSHVIATGVGSSEAHARYFVYLINNYTNHTAEFKTLSHFYPKFTQNYKKTTLALFSQGLSPNASIALEQSDRFEHSLLFTASDAKPPTPPRNPVCVIKFPVKDEYAILLRTIGPLCGYYAAYSAVRDSIPVNTLPAAPKTLISTLEKAVNKLPHNVDTLLDRMKSGCMVLATSPLVTYAQNLAYKLSEGLYIPMPAIVDFLSFAHGPFQELLTNPRPLIILTGSTPAEESLIQRGERLFAAVGAPKWVVRAELESPWKILEFEMLLNHFVLKGMRRFNTNQKKWPGKGLDAELYNLKHHFSE